MFAVAKGVQSGDVMRGEMVEAELDRLIERRSRKGDVALTSGRKVGRPL
jgi:hypothetical protein